jgi:uncharacterized protein DUF1553/uncharacterized protein DUF1549/cytochrome c
MKHTYFLKLFVIGLMLICANSLSGRRATAKDTGKDTEKVSFNRDIRPIFSDTCFRCHGPDKNARKAGLRLDVREEAIVKRKSGVTPIVPGKPEESEIINRIFAGDELELMPPKDAHKTLTAKQKELIRRWVAEGAMYEGHWAYQPISRPAAPAAPASANAPTRNPVDAFIQARLMKEGLQPSPEADRRTLIRRVSLDLTGLPPTPREVAAFVNDRSPDAYENLVGRLLESPSYAEKQAMNWLDAVRYADTSGFHGDNLWPAWPYRDYVLRAFRDNKPFDEFTREQLAGDLLPNATTEQKIASAYNRLNRVSAEGGLQPKEYLAKYAADRVRTTSIVWMGATMGCAECHDHKFDPFLSKDFYALKAFFADIKETGLVPDRGRAAWGSKMTLPSEAQRKRFDELSRRLTWTRAELDEKAAPLLARRAEWEKDLLRLHETGMLAWRFQRPVSAKSSNGATLTIYNDEPLTVTVYRRGALVTEEIKGDGLVVASGVNPENETYAVTFKPGAGEWTALGLEVAQDESLPADRQARGADRFVVTEIDAEMPSDGKGGRKGAAKKLNFVLATTDGAGEWPENHAMNAIDGDPKTGWGCSFADGRGSFIALRLGQRLRTDADSVITVRLRHDSAIRKATIGRFRVALSSAEYSWPDHTAKTPTPMNGLAEDALAALKTPTEKRDDAQNKKLLDFFKWSAPELQTLVIEAARQEAELDLLDSEIPRVMITEATTPAKTRVLARGDFMDESGEMAQPAIPAVFGKLDTGTRRPTRLDLANWIASKKNPLTARVFANRMWRQFFGAGLSRTLDDLGSQGEWPSHPELLDWLASEFLHPAYAAEGAHDWDVKHLIRVIVTSHTYRQSSLSDPSLDERDPDGRLLARQSRFRLDAEIVHDVALSVSGLLVEKLGGPSVRPYQPEGHLKALNFPQRDYSADRGPNLYRRGLYTQWQRTFLHPSLMAFDAPSREECAVNRVNSNTPLQALALLNGPIYVEASRAFAQRILKQGGPTVDAQITWAFESALCRPPKAVERRALRELLRKSLLKFRNDRASARAFISIGEATNPKGLSEIRLAAMTVVARAILNLHETITRD